ncbi:flagellar motor protein MotB [Boseongicola aestuarii]|uniref:Motility protein B n=1 Tax=Boseongicola aestuarii TaxID=1470561 RepID=A0A238IZ97_9RHOB|nr:flagellar motor protein MotB [Boseongicola aestuarii]SMX23080.1 Motility protein B [Boseongicola aestuarii]
MSAASNAPIIIKRKKVIAGGHHGGAWKVAYADFVTAMMAFFLLMWLLGATNEKQRKGIADYFNPTIPIMKASGGGDGAFGGDSIFSQNSLASQGTGAATTYSTEEGAANRSAIDGGTSAQSAAQEAAMLAEMADALSGRSGESMVSALLGRHIVTRLTDEGMIVEVFDLPDAPLFTETAEPTVELRSIVLAVAEVFRLVSNDIATQTHTAAVPLVSAENHVWEQSSKRADQVRQMLESAGLDPRRMQRVTGFADRRPVTRDPLSIRNNRVEMILLRSRL